MRLFIAFRILFNARLYYPVFTILFLDLGLSLEQFFVLNAVWAGTIVALEVPSGAFADTFGRRNLLVLAAACMVVEMAMLLFAPIGSPLTFWLLLGNRLFSGTAEAMASGADEALAFDSLKREGMDALWPDVLDRQMRYQSAVFFVAMLGGAALYDAELVNRVTGWVGLDLVLAPEQTLRLPLAVTFVSALAVAGVALAMKEVGHDAAEDGAAPKTAAQAFALTWETGRWIAASPAVLVIIAVALCYDNIVRIFLTVNSEYYRLIGFPEATLGVLGALMALCGMILPRAARWLVATRSKRFNFVLIGGIILLGLLGVATMTPGWGVFPAMLVSISIFPMAFFTSHYMNERVDSHRRATALSFRSLACNIAYGGAGLLYGGATVLLRTDGEDAKEALFAEIMAWTPVYFLTAWGLLGLFCLWQARRAETRN